MVLASGKSVKSIDQDTMVKSQHAWYTGLAKQDHVPSISVFQECKSSSEKATQTTHD
jgi:hypothetical protein